MTKVRSVPGGGRAVELPPERLHGWFERFGERHGGVRGTEIDQTGLVVTAEDGSRAELAGEFEPGTWPGLEIGQVLDVVMRPKRIGLLLVRLGGHSIGIAFDGEVEVSTTDSHLVHGRNKAGGWSQQRFARRREGQARVALQAAADDAVRVLAPRIGELDAVVLGGDRQALDVLREDRRLAEVFAKAVGKILDVAEPRRAVLDDAAVRARAVEVVVRESA